MLFQDRPASDLEETTLILFQDFNSNIVKRISFLEATLRQSGGYQQAGSGSCPVQV